MILLLFSDAAPQFEIVVYGQGGAGPPAAVMKMIMLKACYFFEPVLSLQGDEAVWRSPKITAPLVRQDYPS